MPNLYLVHYKTQAKKAKHHQALFIEFEPEHGEQAARGSVYEVDGPRHRGEDLHQFHFMVGTNKAPDHSSQFVSKQVIGCVRDNAVDRFFDICEAVTPPIVKSTYKGESPNCCDWINNVLYRLKQHSIVEFNDNFSVPSREVSMNYKDWKTMAPGSSSKSGKPSFWKRSSKG